MNKTIVILFLILVGISFSVNADKIEATKNEVSNMTTMEVLPTPVLENITQVPTIPMNITPQERQYKVYLILPNARFDKLAQYNDSFSDENGIRAYPWGFEHQQGDMLNYFENGTARMVGNSEDDATLFAIPDLLYDKPVIVEGHNYTLSFDVKLTNVSGHGVRMMQQWFNTSNPKIMPFPFQHNSDNFENGTLDWHTITYTVIAPRGAIRGDPVIEMWGSGMVEVKNPKYYVDALNETDMETMPYRSFNKAIREDIMSSSWTFGTCDCDRLKIMKYLVPTGNETQDKRINGLMESIAWSYNYYTVDDMLNYCIRSNYNMSGPI